MPYAWFFCGLALPFCWTPDPSILALSYHSPCGYQCWCNNRAPPSSFGIHLARGVFLYGHSYLGRPNVCGAVVSNHPGIYHWIYSREHQLTRLVGSGAKLVPGIPQHAQGSSPLETTLHRQQLWCCIFYLGSFIGNVYETRPLSIKVWTRSLLLCR